MVAVTTTHHSRPTLRSSGRHLALVPRPVEGQDPARVGGGVHELSPVRHEVARCGCHRHGTRVVVSPRRLGVELSPSAAVPPSSSVYRRRRLVAALVVAGSVLVAWAGLGALGGALTASGRSAPGLGTPAAAQVVEVAPGDTFWSIARRLQPTGDVRPLVDRLVRAHGSTVLGVGERIAMPGS